MIFQYHFIHTFYRCFSTNHHRLNSERHLSPLRLHPIEADAPGSQGTEQFLTVSEQVKLFDSVT